MNKDVYNLIKILNIKQKNNKLFKSFISTLSFLVMIITIYFLTLPALTQTIKTPYKLYLRDTYLEGDYSWKLENNYITDYTLNLYFEDTLGNSITGHDVTINIGPDTLTDVPYGFDIVPLENDIKRGEDLISILNLNEYTLPTGEKYIFDHAEVYTDGSWKTFSDTGNHWHIWCQSASSKTLNTNYGWKGNYNESTRYIIDENTEYKFVYKLIRLSINEAVSSLGTESGITFNLFNYDGDNTKTGVNANGLYDYFTFRGIGNTEDKYSNTTTDQDGFTDNHATVLPKLEDGYPVFDCKGLCTGNTSIKNTSLGYLFGSLTNPLGNATTGVTSYKPINTLLQKETIDNVDYYYYDSNKNAVDYDIENNRFMLRDYQERGYSISTYKNETNRYEFRPFNYLTNPNNLLTNPTTNSTYNYEENDIDHWYGMTMEFDFYMPRNSLIEDKDMIFSFSGDDDVWIFIDDVLVLDLGGTHGAVDGTINFRTGQVESYLNWNNVVGTKNITNIYDRFKNASSLDNVKWNSTNTTFANYTKHTLKFFYLERGAAVANCKIRFNVPVLPSGSLSVQKEFNGNNKYPDDVYEFTLYDATSNTPVANTEYTKNNETTIYKTDELGRFTLKNKEIATFLLASNHTYYVEETNTGSHAISDKCTLDGVSCPAINKTNEFTINPDSTYLAIFTNKVKTYDLNISKIAYNSNPEEEFLFQLNLTDNLDVPVDIPNNSDKYIIDNGLVTFSLKNNESIKIEDIPIDTIVTLAETKHDGYQAVIKSGEVILSNNDTYKFIIDTNKDITVYNIPGVILPDTGGIGGLKYFKIGIFLIITSLGLRLYLSIKINKKEGDNISILQVENKNN